MKVLFFTPYFGKTGSEMCLFDLLTAANNQYFETGICVMNGTGELLKSLPFAAQTFNYLDFRKKKIAQNEAQNTRVARVVRVLNPFNWFSTSQRNDDRYDVQAFIQYALEEFQPDVCYVNTLVLHDVIKTLGHYKIRRIILHSHESDNMLGGLTSEQVNMLIKQAHLVITPSAKTLKMFNLLGRGTNIELFYEAIDFTKIKIDAVRIGQLKAIHSITHENFIWAMSGTIDPNKDTVAFVELAYLVSNKKPLARFIWMGKGESAYADYCKSLANSYGLKERILWVEPNDADYYNYFAMCNAFVLTSRQDTFPLVMLEAAYLEKPLVSFDSGGVSEFLGEEYKYLLVKSRSLEEMAVLMEKLMRGEIEIKGAELKRMAEKYSAKSNAVKWVKMITSL